MSQLLVPSHTVVHSIPIGRRISEIMKEKGAAFSTQSVANRLKMSRETFRGILVGKRDIFNYELEHIATCLHVTTERILQNDIQKDAALLSSLLDSKSDKEKALQLARGIHSVAIGISENSIALKNIASALFALGDYNQAHEFLMRSYHLAESIAEKYEDYDILYEPLSKLMITFTLRNEFTKLSDILERVEGFFQDSPEKQGAIYYSKAMIAEHGNHVEQERANWYRSLECFLLSGKENDIGRAELNAGYFEFRHQNYEKANLLIGSAVNRLASDYPYKLVALKEYAKTFLKLGDKEKAIALLEDHFDELDEYPQLKGKYLLLLAMAKNDVTYIEKIYSIQEAEKYFL